MGAPYRYANATERADAKLARTKARKAQGICRSCPNRIDPNGEHSLCRQCCNKKRTYRTRVARGEVLPSRRVAIEVAGDPFAGVPAWWWDHL